MTIKKKRVVRVICVVLIVLGLSAFVMRGWIRGTIGPAIARSMHAQSVQVPFEENLKELNPRLEQFGLSMTASDVLCGVFGYESLHATYRCHQSAASKSPDTDESYKEKWRLDSLSIESYLLHHGWRKMPDTNQSINELLVTDQLRGSVSVNYQKVHDKTACNLTIRYLGLRYEADIRFAALLSCERYVKFFGGYQVNY